MAKLDRRADSGYPGHVDTSLDQEETESSSSSSSQTIVGTELRVLGSIKIVCGEVVTAGIHEEGTDMNESKEGRAYGSDFGLVGLNEKLLTLLMLLLMLLLVLILILLLLSIIGASVVVIGEDTQRRGLGWNSR